MSPLRAASAHYGFRSRQGCSPARHVPLFVPLPTSAFCRSLLVVSTYEGEAVDTVTPAGLPQEPSPYEEDKHRYATSMSVSSGPWRWIPLGVVGPFVFFFVVHFLLLFLFVVFFVYDGYASS